MIKYKKFIQKFTQKFTQKITQKIPPKVTLQFKTLCSLHKLWRFQCKKFLACE